MAQNLYVLLFIDTDMSDYKIYNDYTIALKEYLKHSIVETRSLLEEETSEEETSEEETSEEETSEEETSEEISEVSDEETCIFQLCKLNIETSEFQIVKDYNIDHFQDFVKDKEDLEDYLNSLEQILKENVELPTDILTTFIM